VLKISAWVLGCILVLSPLWLQIGFVVAVAVDTLQSNIACALRCDNSSLATTVQLSDADLRGPHDVIALTIGQTLGARFHGGMAAPLRPDPSVLQVIDQQLIGSAQLTARYRAVGIGMTNVGVQFTCHWGGCAAATGRVSVAVVSTTTRITLTDADDGRVVDARRGQLIDIGLAGGWLWTVTTATTGRPLVVNPLDNSGRDLRVVYLATRAGPEQIVAMGELSGGVDPVSHEYRQPLATRTFTVTVRTVP
jgi:hypothetical protein